MKLKSMRVQVVNRPMDQVHDGCFFKYQVPINGKYQVRINGMVYHGIQRRVWGAVGRLLCQDLYGEPQ